MSQRILISLAFAITLVLGQAIFGSPATAQERSLPTPEGPVVLTITGQISSDFTDGAVDFDIAGLESIGTVDIETETPWTEGVVRFTGIRARDLLDAVGAEGRSVKTVALNDYAISIPIEDLQDYEVIIAVRRDGELMRVRDRGPLWVIYPWTDHVELRTEVYYARSIWQLRSIEVIE